MLKNVVVTVFALLFFLLVVIIWTPAADAAGLPKSFLGHWVGHKPKFTPAGPRLASHGGVNFTFRAIDENNWFGVDSVGRSDEMQGSQQQFWWFREDASGDYFMKYCGWLLGWSKTLAHHGPVVTMRVTEMSDRKMEMVYVATTMEKNYSWLYLPWNIRWSLEIQTDPVTGQDYLVNWLRVPSGPDYQHEHLLVNMTKHSSDPMPFLKPGHRSQNSPPRCNFTMPPQRWRGEKQHEDAKSEQEKDLDDAENVANDPRTMCPHGYTAKAGFKMPEFIKKRIGDRRRELRKQKQQQHQQQQQQQQKIVSSPSAALTSSNWQNCALLSTYMNMKVRWNYNRAERNVKVWISAKATALPASRTWISLGMMMAWPSMKGMDLVLGYLTPSGEGCVRSMYSPYDARPPVDSPEQQITGGAVWTSTEQDGDDYINMEFIRHWATGHWTISDTGPRFPSSYKFIPTPNVAAATGRAPNTCTEELSFLHYHQQYRLTHGFNWSNASAAIMPDLMC